MNNEINKTLSDYAPKTFIGIHDGEKIFLSAPTWDCGWYWGFGYLGNKNRHYHVDGLTKIETYNTDGKCFESKSVNLFDGFREHFGDTFKITDKDLWTLCELFKTFYTLKETAELLGRGGSHYTTNPCADLIKNPDETHRINNVVLPQIFEEIYRVLNNASARFDEEQAAKIVAEEARLQKEIDQRQTEKDGKMMLLNNGISTENVIFYSHTNKWCFGWRKPLSSDEQKNLFAQLSACGFVDTYATEFKYQ